MIIEKQFKTKNEAIELVKAEQIQSGKLFTITTAKELDELLKLLRTQKRLMIISVDR